MRGHKIPYSGIHVNTKDLQTAVGGLRTALEGVVRKGGGGGNQGAGPMAMATHPPAPSAQGGDNAKFTPTFDKQGPPFALE